MDLMEPCQLANLATMPIDVLEEIFSQIITPIPTHTSTRTYCQVGSYGLIKSFFNSTVSPLNLCHVNSYLRHVALHQSSLWSYIYVYNIRVIQLPLLEIWLQRAGSRALTLDFEVPFSCKTVDGLLPALQILLSHSARWKSLALVLPSSAQYIVPPAFLSSLGFRYLESAVLRLVDWQPSNREQIAKLLFSSSSLRHVHWLDTFGSDIPQHVPWQQLNDLDLLYPIEEKKLFDVLSKSTSLQKLRLGAVYSYPTLQPTSLTVGITSLTIAATSVLEMLLSQVKLPKLVELCIENVHWHPSRGGWDRIQSLFCGLGHAHLTHFTYTSRLAHGNGSAENDIAALLLLPGMSTLRYLNMRLDMTAKIVLLLTHSGDAESADANLPFLETITLRRCALADGLLSNMVRSRTSGARRFGARISSVSATVRESWGFPIDMEAFQGFRQEGLSATLVTELVM